MQPKLLKSSQKHEFIPAFFTGNHSGYEPVGYHILVLPDMAAEKSSGGIDLPPEFVERATMAAETGILVALGPDAFIWNGDRSRKSEGERPKPGDRVYIQRYSGQVMFGEDGVFYRVMDYNCVAAVKPAVALQVIA